MLGFNVGVTISLGDMELAIDYMNEEKDVVETGLINSDKTHKDIQENSVGQEEEEKEYEKNKATSEESEDIGINNENTYEEDDEYDEDYDCEEDDDYKEDYSDDEEDDDYYEDYEDDSYEDGKDDEKDEDTNGKNEGDVDGHKESIDTKNESEYVSTKEDITSKYIHIAKDRIGEGKQSDADRIVSKDVKPSHKKQTNIEHIGEEQKIEGNVGSAGKEYEEYVSMDVDSLYKKVKNYMTNMGVGKKLILKKQLEEEFGAKNIKRLIMKSYLISLGNKVTIGR